MVSGEWCDGEVMGWDDTARSWLVVVLVVIVTA